MMLVALLISLALPTMMSFLSTATSSMAEDKAAQLAERIAATLEEMSAGGPGNVRTMGVPVELPANIRISLGGENGTADSMRIRWYVDGREGIRYLEDVIVLTDGGKALTVTAGDTLRLECSPGAWGTIKAVLV